MCSSVHYYFTWQLIYYRLIAACASFDYIILIYNSASHYERMKYCKSDTINSHIIIIIIFYNKIHYNIIIYA